MDARYYNGEPGPEHDPGRGGAGQRYRCRDCGWTGRGASAVAHHQQTGHEIEHAVLRLLMPFSARRAS